MACGGCLKAVASSSESAVAGGPEPAAADSYEPVVGSSGYRDPNCKVEAGVCMWLLGCCALEDMMLWEGTSANTHIGTLVGADIGMVLDHPCCKTLLA